MPDENPNLDVRATLDASGVTQNAPQAASAIRDVGNAAQEAGAKAEESAEETEKLTAAIQAQRSAMMQNIFQAHRLMEGFKDLSEGGRLASQGMVDLEETLGRFLPPQAQVALAIASAVGLLAMMATRHRGAAGAAKEHAESEKEAAEAIDKGSEALIKFAASAANVHLEVQTEALKEYLKVQEQLVSNQTRLDDANDRHLTNLQAQAKATQDLGLAELKRQEALDLQGAAGDEQKQARIKLQYAGREAAMKGGNEQEANNAEQTLLAQQKQEDDAKRATLVQENIDKQAQLDALKADAAAKAAKAKGEGFNPNEAGSFEDQIKQQEEAFKKARQDALGIGDISTRDILEGPTHVANKQAQIQSAQRNVQDQSSKLADLRDAQSAREAYLKDGVALTASIEKTSAEIDKLVSKLDDIYSRQTVLSTESKAKATDTGTAGITNATATQELYYKDVDKNTEDLVKKSKEVRDRAKKSSEADYQKTDLQPAQQRVEQDRAAVEAFQAAQRETQDHNATVVGLLGKHMESTRAANAATKSALDELKAKLAADEASTRALQEAHKAAQTNALQ